MKTQQLPTQYLTRNHPPASPEEFVGGARQAAINLERALKQALNNGCPPLKYFFSGESGVGKTALCYFAERVLGVSKWGITEYNGTDVTIDRVREIQDGLALTCNEMFGPYRIIEIHEADCIPSVAQVKLLTLLDNLPARAAVFCTANSDLDDMEERFQRRFKYTSVKGATGEEIRGLLERWDIPALVANNIANMCNGCVAMALIEAEEWLQNTVA